VGDQDVEAPVGGAEEVVGLGRGVGLAAFDHRGELGDLRFARALRGQLGGPELEAAAVGEQVAHAVAVQREHARSGARRQLLGDEHSTATPATRLEVAGVVQQTQGLAHGRARELELLRQAALGREALSRRQ